MLTSKLPAEPIRHCPIPRATIIQAVLPGILLFLVGCKSAETQQTQFAGLKSSLCSVDNACIDGSSLQPASGAVGQRISSSMCLEGTVTDCQVGCYKAQDGVRDACRQVAQDDPEPGCEHKGFCVQESGKKATGSLHEVVSNFYCKRSFKRRFCPDGCKVAEDGKLDLCIENGVAFEDPKAVNALPPNEVVASSSQSASMGDIPVADRWDYPSNAPITQEFGGSWSGGAGHLGMDIGVAPGHDLKAMADGQIATIARDVGNYFEIIVVRHRLAQPSGPADDTYIYSAFCHVSVPSNLREGDIVRKGEVIAQVASNALFQSVGWGAHLHLVMYNQGFFDAGPQTIYCSNQNIKGCPPKGYSGAGFSGSHLQMPDNAGNAYLINPRSIVENGTF